MGNKTQREEKRDHRIVRDRDIKWSTIRLDEQGDNLFLCGRWIVRASQNNNIMSSSHENESWNQFFNKIIVSTVSVEQRQISAPSAPCQLLKQIRKICNIHVDW